MVSDDEEWRETEALLGKIVIEWGKAMGLVYSLPKEMGFENFAAIRLGLAQFNSDGLRLAYMEKLISHEPRLFHDPRDRAELALAALKALGKLGSERDALMHGIPVSDYARDPKTREKIREGAYLIQQRKWDKGRFIKVPDAAVHHLKKLKEVNVTLLRVAKPMLFEGWVEIFGFHPAEDTAAD
ncbi:hypothetical protein FB008_102227 [Sinorhizobium medicae]|uniref:hypothetical protein n=1 Tax=Sinorhizobium medicae TaxID=110321 RepID=UPI00119DF53D|nr:hypothetical protein [Sinorhizobium medicae]TWA55659.1 hypothetical protein FB008_102227 [Sinorhizobium medicae]